MFVRMAALMRGLYVPEQQLSSFYDRLADFLKFFAKRAKDYCVLESYVDAEEAMAAPVVTPSPRRKSRRE
jgi:hypothetical protein